MTLDDARPFLEANHRAVVTTHRRSGAIQTSIVTGGLHENLMVFVVAGRTAKLANLGRDPRCTVLTVRPDWSGFVAVEGTASVRAWEGADPEEQRILLRDIYRVCGGGEHPDWEEYDTVMRRERRTVVMVTADHVYGIGY